MLADTTAARTAVLNNRSLPALRRRVRVPEYDRTTLTPAVVHLGVGGFHRAHQAVYLDDLANQGETGWGEVGVGLRSPAMRDALLPQDCLFTVVERGRGGDRARVLGAMTRYLFGPDDPGAVLDALAAPHTRVVTLTITGGGYPLAGGEFSAADPDVRADLAAPRVPRTVFGYVVEALARRRRAGLPAFTVLSCDNLPDNGAAARAAVLGLAERRAPGLAAWIETHASFPASMVDRITPETGDALRELVVRRFGVPDRWPVAAEPFSQWIVADQFCAGRPPLDRVGVRFVDDVAPYRLLKTRLLNGCHSAIGYLGALAGGYRTTSDVLADPVFAGYLAALMRTEIAPVLRPVLGIDVEAYQRTLLGRFANPRISDPLSRLCARGSTKMPAYLLPSLIDARRRGRPSELLTLAVAAWFRYLRGSAADGSRIDVADARAGRLQTLAAADDPRAL
ncbi:MAG TPA: mannitol dehydrogenase family protein, partial [Pilimelia sp.]|nr:mannitol dehydrogenase family protein [Pilimelia sp.]